MLWKHCLPTTYERQIHHKPSVKSENCILNLPVANLFSSLLESLLVFWKMCSTPSLQQIHTTVFKPSISSVVFLRHENEVLNFCFFMHFASCKLVIYSCESSSFLEIGFSSCCLKFKLWTLEGIQYLLDAIRRILSTTLFDFIWNYLKFKTGFEQMFCKFVCITLGKLLWTTWAIVVNELSSLKNVVLDENTPRVSVILMLESNADVSQYLQYLEYKFYWCQIFAFRIALCHHETLKYSPRMRMANFRPPCYRIDVGPNELWWSLDGNLNGHWSLPDCLNELPEWISWMNFLNELSA